MLLCAQNKIRHVSHVVAEEDCALPAGDLEPGEKDGQTRQGNDEHDPEVETEQSGRDCQSATPCNETAQTHAAKNIESVAANDIPDGNVALTLECCRQRGGYFWHGGTRGNDRQANDEVTHAERLGERDRRTDQPVGAEDEQYESRQD